MPRSTAWLSVACALNLPALRSLLLAPLRGLCMPVELRTRLRSQNGFGGYPIEEADENGREDSHSHQDARQAGQSGTGPATVGGVARHSPQFAEILRLRRRRNRSLRLRPRRSS